MSRITELWKAASSYAMLTADEDKMVAANGDLEDLIRTAFTAGAEWQLTYAKDEKQT